MVAAASPEIVPVATPKVAVVVEPPAIQYSTRYWVPAGFVLAPHESDIELACTWTRAKPVGEAASV